jgi:hypothetical protein
MILQEWKERRRLRGKIKRFPKRLAHIVAPSGSEEYKKVFKEFEALNKSLEYLETIKLERAAMRLGIDIPYDKEGWSRKIQIIFTVIPVLTERGRAGVRKMIRDERFKTTEQWIKILLPILALIVAILSLLRK